MCRLVPTICVSSLLVELVSIGLCSVHVGKGLVDKRRVVFLSLHRVALSGAREEVILSIVSTRDVRLTMASVFKTLFFEVLDRA